MTIRRFALPLLAALTVVGPACSGGVDVDPIPGITVADGLTVTEMVDGFDGPTQIAHHPDGRLLVAELNGGESDGTGRVLAVDLEGDPANDRDVLVEGLLTPTGVAAVGDELWVMEERTLSRGPLDGGSLEAVLTDLPFNGRSETTLTPTPSGTLLYGTSGSLSGGQPREGSGILWELDPGNPGDPDPVPVSAGFKNAYGHTVDDDGRLWATEVSDGDFDGQPAPDELVEVTPGVDHGWPACIGDRTPVVEFGGDPATCDSGPPSQALFRPGATPTSVAVAPWDPTVLVVALWVDRMIVAVPTDPADAPHEPVELVSGDLRPQHLLVDGDRLLVVDFDGGRILAITGN